jgi:hypothetical protein
MPVLKTTRKAPSFYFGLFALLLMISIYLSFQVKSMHRQIVLAQQEQQHLYKDLHATIIRFRLIKGANDILDGSLFQKNTSSTLTGKTNGK